MSIKRPDRETLINDLLWATLILVLVALFVLFYEKGISALGMTIGFLGNLLFPFAIAWLVAVVSRPLKVFLVKRLHLPPSLAVVLMMLAMLTVLGLIVMLVISMLSELFANLAAMILTLDSTASDLLASLRDLYVKLDLDFSQVSQYLSGVTERISALASQGITIIFDVIKGTPSAFVLVLVTVVAIFYWCRDEEKIKLFIARLAPASKREWVVDTYDSLSQLIGGYVRAQMLLVTLSIIICMLGFTILNANSPIAMGLLTGVVDVIPILGPGTLIVPWAVWALLDGQTFLGFGLFVVFATTTISRNILEPKLVGDRMGMHPLLAMAAIFVGMRVFGVVGLILGPILLGVGIQMARHMRRDEMPTPSAAAPPQRKFLQKFSWNKKTQQPSATTTEVKISFTEDGASRDQKEE